MAKKRLYQSPLLNFLETDLGKMDVLLASDPISGEDGGFMTEDYDFTGNKWW